MIDRCGSCVVSVETERITLLQAELVALHAELAGLRIAMASRATIEQAKGLVMGAMHCTPDAAFDVLVAQSQHQNRKLYEIAAEMVALQLR
jgi:AmiR/NasT family two-component response regulator